MVRKLTYILLFFVLSFVDVFAQSEIVSELKQQVKQGNYSAVLQSVSEPNNAKDVELRQYLKNLASDEKQRIRINSAAFFAHIALAKLGEPDAREQILAEVDSNTPLHISGMKKLFLTGGKFAFQKFYILLDDSTQIKVEENCEGKASSFCGDVVYYPKNFMAIYYLSKMVENPPTPRGKPSNKVALWKDWFENHKELIQ